MQHRDQDGQEGELEVARKITDYREDDEVHCNPLCDVSFYF